MPLVGQSYHKAIHHVQEKSTLKFLVNETNKLNICFAYSAWVGITLSFFFYFYFKFV